MLKGPVLTKALGLGLIKDLILGVVMIKGPVLTKALDLGQTKDLILGVEVKGVPGQRTPRMIATPMTSPLVASSPSKIPSKSSSSSLMTFLPSFLFSRFICIRSNRWHRIISGS